jgi:hypothetical protein
VVVRHQTESLPTSFLAIFAGRRLSSTLGVFRPLFENLRAWELISQMTLVRQFPGIPQEIETF